MIDPGEYREDDRLALRARAGDAGALGTLYRRWAPPLLAYLERTLGDRSEAEDALHDAFLRLLEGRGRYEGRGRFRSWIFTVATRLALDRLRRGRRRETLAPSVAAATAPVTPPDPWSSVVHAELLRRLDATLADLPPAYAMAFHLRVREQLAYREMAAVCGEPEGTLRSRVHHALARIRRSLDPERRPAPRPRSETE